MYTVVCDYSATGEGRSIMVLYTRGYTLDYTNDEQDFSPEYWALKRFKRTFGGWFARGATAYPGMIFDFPGAELLLSDKMKESLQVWEKVAGGLEYYAQVHVNFS